MDQLSAAVASVLLALYCAAASPAPESAAPRSDAPPLATRTQPMTLLVDASQAGRGVMSTHLHVPVRPGPFTLVYPKWIPGEHAPSGPLNNMANLHISAAGADLRWERDLVDMYAFHVDVPAGVSSLDIDMTVLLNSAQETVASGRTAIVMWNRVLLYQADSDAEQLFVRPSIVLPPRWDYATALPGASRAGQRIDFPTVSLATLVDSPLDLGSETRHVQLWRSGGSACWLHVFADKPQDLAVSAQTWHAYRRLVPETLAMYGARHWQNYHFLLTLSGSIDEQGIEHHESSDNRDHDDFLTNDARMLTSGDLLPHEFSHSWNGKFRRPASLTTANYQLPQKTDLLWVYEGLNQYIGDVLSFRAGIRKAGLYPELVASAYADMDSEPGRRYDSLADTAAAAPYLGLIHGAEYPSLRRAYEDFYTEGELLWLDVDTIIRDRSRGARSLDDFLRRFAGPPDSAPAIKTYTRLDIENLLNEVQPYGWADFFLQHVYAPATHPPTDEFERAGWRIVYTTTPNEYAAADESSSHQVDAWYSLGVRLDEDGSVRDVRDASPAWQAGIASHMQVVAIGQQQFSKEILEYALANAQRTRTPMSLLLKRGDWYETRSLAYFGGARYPHLVRLAARPDMLARIVAPRTH
ncbi:MAG: hypothetical protein M3Z37_01790 [Candidatus Eremiobacteraeota bacterium]|nr:hypothetical protein [Candidatus Eremiobacteraeota bacterium]